MKCVFVFILMIIIGDRSTGIALAAGSQPIPPPETSLFIPEKKPGADQPTLNTLDKQNKKLESGDRSLKNYQSSLAMGQEKAEQMVGIIQNEQFQKVMEKLTQRGNQLVKENQELQNPAAVIAAAAVLWYGRTIKLIKSENFKLNTKINANRKESEFSMQSPLVNGSLQYNANSGMNITVNRSISSIGSSAGVRYNAQSKSIGTELHQQISPHINFTIGTESSSGSTIDSRAGINYQFNF